MQPQLFFFFNCAALPQPKKERSRGSNYKFDPGTFSSPHKVRIVDSTICIITPEALSYLSLKVQIQKSNRDR